MPVHLQTIRQQIIGKNPWTSEKSLWSSWMWIYDYVFDVRFVEDTPPRSFPARSVTSFIPLSPMWDRAWQLENCGMCDSAGISLISMRSTVEGGLNNATSIGNMRGINAIQRCCWGWLHHLDPNCFPVKWLCETAAPVTALPLPLALATISLHQGICCMLEPEHLSLSQGV